MQFKEEIMKVYRHHLAVFILGCLGLVLSACQQTATPLATERNRQLELIESGTIDAQYLRDGTYATAFVWANNPGAALNIPYTPNTDYQYNRRFDQSPSSGGRNTYPLGTNKVTRRGTGRYEVEFPNLNFFGGVMHAAAYGSNGHCKVWDWFPRGGSKLTVSVYCFSSTGAPTNMPFTLLFYKNASNLTTHGIAYLWSNNASPAGTYTPDDLYQYNSRGVNNTVTRLGIGQYRVKFPSMQRNAAEQNKGGTVLVTAYGTNNVYCKVVGWEQDATNAINAGVNCFNASGSSADSLFTASFLREPGTLGIANDADESAAHYVWADQPSTASYTPDTFYQSWSSPSSSAGLITRLSTGSYRVSIKNLKAANDTTAIVTAYGGGSARCSIQSWGGSAAVTDVLVNCYSSSGAASDQLFVLYYLTK